MKKIIAILGTNSKESTNRKLLNNIKEMLKDKAYFEIIEISKIGYVEKGFIPDEIKELTLKIKDADGLVISSVEYLHAPSAALINFLDWMSTLPKTIKDKPVFLCSANHGRSGSIKALSILKQILQNESLSPLVFSKDFIINNSLEAFDAKGGLIDENLKLQLDQLLSEFLSFIEIFRPEK
ncbi:MAG: NAD(P)H-dependent oxidoreductase [Tissierellia bacterium]|nr:NAD(P)H-dependent oxidoreductase [Tissierellia bacterium]